MQGRAQTITAYSYPPAPWLFKASRIHYQFRQVATPAALPTVPDDGIDLLSLNGNTLGGFFAVEYESSPVGPYKEVAVLSSLVARQWGLGGIGAWASHIFVDSEAAAEAGKDIWGLPASVVQIDFDASSIVGNENDDAPVSFFLSDEMVKVSNWAKSKEDTTSSFPLDVTLPSFSGCLDSSASGEDNNSALLRYPLRIFETKSFSIASAGEISYTGDDKSLQAIVESSQSLLSINVGGVNLCAGVPDIISTPR